MKTMTRAEWLAEGERRFGPDARKWKFVCPMCKTEQSAEDFIATGQFTPGTGQVNKVLGFSCVGRYNGTGAFQGEKQNKGRGCDWTLGGLFQVHELEVIDDAGERHPRFEFAEPQPVTKEAA